MEKSESVEHSKRNFVVGGAAAVMTGALVPAGIEGYKKYVNQHTVTAEVAPVDIPNPAEKVEQYDNLSNSGYFLHEVSLHTASFERDVDIALSKTDIITKIQTEFTVPGIPSLVIRNSIEALMPALAYVESRFDTEAESHKKAFGVLQIMPETWDDLAKEGEDKNSLSDQIKVAARLIEQTYRHITQSCSKELAIIKQNYFTNDAELFYQCFMSPVLMNAYNAGMGSLSRLIMQFAETYPTPASSVELFEQSEQLTGFDVFVGMSHTAYHQEWLEWYKQHATDYTAKIYSANQVLVAAFTKEVEARLE